ncbi:MAG: oxidoreductase, partial [Xanthomonadaceae bacterium]|nr:oxidoreductase [Xanthomonadaceae bacterium]
MGLSVRLDAISCGMFLLVAFVGVIVVQYSRNYMDGDGRQGAFMAGLCRT